MGGVWTRFELMLVEFAISRLECLQTVAQDWVLEGLLTKEDD